MTAMIDEVGQMTAEELRRRLAGADYDTVRLDLLSRDLGFDLIALLAAWAPILVRILEGRAKRSLWQRFLWWRRG